MRKIGQNLFLAFIYDIIGVPVVAEGMLNPVVGAAAMALSSVSVVTNSPVLKHWLLQRPATNASASSAVMADRAALLAAEG